MEKKVAKSRNSIQTRSENPEAQYTFCTAAGWTWKMKAASIGPVNPFISEDSDNLRRIPKKSRTEIKWMTRLSVCHGSAASSKAEKRTYLSEYERGRQWP